MSVVINLGIIIFAGIVIYFFGNIFAESSSKIGDYFRLSKSVKGATFDAGASSLPELFVALYAVVFFRKFEVGIGTIAGSALFNLLVIPGVCILISPIVLRISKEVITRDALFYIISVAILLGLIFFLKFWGLIVASILLITYLLYLLIIVRDTKIRQKTQPCTDKPQQIRLFKQANIAVLTMTIVGVASYFLVSSSLNLSNILSIPPIIVALTITAAATSVPDAVISVVNARKGSWDDAISNVFDSNIFDIFVGLGLPLLIYSFYKGPVQIMFANLEIIAGLLALTVIVLFLFSKAYKFAASAGPILLGMYSVFVGYTILLLLKT